MALKGHAKIELTNVETGEVEVHEDDNMVTNALHELLSSRGDFISTAIPELMNATKDNSVINRLTCGLLMFNSTIEESVNIIEPPAGIELVACASKEGYNGANIMAGSYNLDESGFTDEGGYKHVWDFSTSQGNGEIACIGLTTNTGGKITTGSFPYSSDYLFEVGSNIDDEIRFDAYRSFSEASWNHFKTNLNFDNGKLNRWVLFLDGIRNRMIAPSSFDEVNTYHHGGSAASDAFANSLYFKKSINLDIFRMGFSNISVLDSASASTKTRLLKTVTVDMPTELANIVDGFLNAQTSYYWTVNSVSDDENIYLLLKFGSSNKYFELLQDETVYIWQINAYSFESTYYEFTNKLSESILYGYSGIGNAYNSSAYYLAINGDYILCLGKTSLNYYVIAKNNSDDYNLVTFPDGTICNGEPLCVYNGNYNKFEIAINNTSPLITVDALLHRAMYKNILINRHLMVTSKNYIRIMPVGGKSYKALVSNAGSSYGPYVRLMIEPALLVTINNLEAPVQKTSAQTMKVTYILTQE